MCFAEGIFGALILAALSVLQPHTTRPGGPATHAALSASASGIVVGIIALALFGICGWLVRFSAIRVALLFIDAIACFELLGSLISKPLSLLSLISGSFLFYDLAFGTVLLLSLLTRLGRGRRLAVRRVIGL
jgi:hypothetical protein